MPELKMPKMGDAMEEGTILRWLKNEGDPVEAEEDLAEVQTEKSNITIPASESGVLTRILVKEGETVPVGAAIGELNGASSAASGSKPTAEAAPSPQERAAPGPDREQAPGAEAPASPSPDADLNQNNAATGSAPPAGQAQTQAASPQAASGTEAGSEARVKASPLARKVAAEYGVDLRAVQGTGPGGRIVEADVEEARQRGPASVPAQPTAAPPSREQPAPPVSAAPLAGTERRMSPVRKIIARRLVESKQTIPHFYLTLDVDMRAAWRLRKQYNESSEEERKVSFNDLVVRACVLALEKFPQLNSRLEGEIIKTAASINVGVAVSLEEGLVVPVVRDAQTKSISTVGREVRSLAERARKGELKAEEYSGGTFTVSNLGMYDITQFQAIINAPEAAILAVGAVRDTPIVENEQVVPGKQMFLTISVDHRLVDGQLAARFLQEVKRLLQSPMGLFG
jgi:pyruvate dehydrogenase E2 component (dihydrolipoamide acetyltransferase)